MSADELALFTRCTGRASAPAEVASEAWLVCGRRSGKSFVLGPDRDLSGDLPGLAGAPEPGRARDDHGHCGRPAAGRTIMRYLEALLAEIPMLARTVVAFRAAHADMSIELVGRVTIEVHTASFRTVRGYTVVAALLDELAFWRTEESANPDSEIIAAIRPAMASVPGSMLLAASSPYCSPGRPLGHWRR